MSVEESDMMRLASVLDVERSDIQVLEWILKALTRDPLSILDEKLPDAVTADSMTWIRIALWVWLHRDEIINVQRFVRIIDFRLAHNDPATVVPQDNTEYSVNVRCLDGRNATLTLNAAMTNMTVYVLVARALQWYVSHDMKILSNGVRLPFAGFFHPEANMSLYVTLF